MAKRKKNDAKHIREEALKEELSDEEVADLLRRPESFGYSGDIEGMFETWSLGPVIEHRDSDITTKANRKSLERELKKVPEWEDDWQISGASHWAVGWVDHLSFRVLDENGEPTEIARFLKGWFDYLEHQYPIADEDLHSEMEYEAYSEMLDEDIKALQRSEFREDLPKDWEAQFYDALQKREPEWDYHPDGTPYVAEDTLREIADELGFMEDEDWEENPRKWHRERKRVENGAGWGAFLGALAGGVVGAVTQSMLVGWTLATAGGAIGGYIGAQDDRKKRGAVGGGVGAAILGSPGAALGGWIGGRKPDKKSKKNPAVTKLKNKLLR